MISRRKFIFTTGVTFAGATLSPYSFALGSFRKIKAVAFDGFPIFDPRPVFKKANEFFPEQGKRLTETWRTKQFAYQWLRAAGNNYKNFWDVTEDALFYAANYHELELTEAVAAEIMNEYKKINIWPDVKPGLQQLKDLKLKLCFLTNMTDAMVRQGIQNAGIEEYFDHILTTDAIKTYKPDPKAYEMGVDILEFKKEEILFVAFAGWDVAGAKWFGYPTYWVNRQNASIEHLDVQPDGTGSNMQDLVRYINQYNK